MEFKEILEVYKKNIGEVDYVSANEFLTAVTKGLVNNYGKDKVHTELNSISTSNEEINTKLTHIFELGAAKFMKKQGFYNLESSEMKDKALTMVMYINLSLCHNFKDLNLIDQARDIIYDSSMVICH